jgi:hypothetical protein
MSNSLTGFGFVQVGTSHAVDPSFGTHTYPILSTYATTIARGDPVVLNSSGYVNLATAGDTTILGVFDGCTYTDTAQVSPSQQQNAWTGPSTAVAGSVLAYVIDDPTATFRVRVSNGPITAAQVGETATFVAGTYNSYTGRSTTLLNATTSTTTSYPFKIISVLDAPVNNDSTSSGNIVVVKGNGWWLGSTTGI